jgi:DNA-binding PadR family transcriptional regulator
VLSLLLERPMHPYEMRGLMLERGHDDVIKLKGGSLYDTVERLQRLEFIEPVQTTREGRRPERTVYSITDSGREELKVWLRELLSEPAQEYPQFAAGLAFMAGLEGKEEVEQLLRRRAILLESRIAAADTVLRHAREADAVPRLFLIEGEYGQAMRRAELDWLREVVRDLEAGRLWPDAETWNRLWERTRAASEEVDV